MKLHDLLEASYADVFPKQFEAFRQKYLNVNHEGLFVNFTNFAGDPLEKNPYDSPDHHDMVGVYAYPIEYVLNHPADVWYGANARYLRVMKFTGRKMLVLNDISSYEEMKSLLLKMGIPDKQRWEGAQRTELDHTIEHIRKKFRIRVKEYARLFFAVAQAEIILKRDYYGAHDSEGKPIYFVHYTGRTLSGSDQTKRFLRAGIDAVEDTSGRTGDSDRAIIHWREPEQACFFHRTAFKVVESFALRNFSTKKGLTITWTNEKLPKLAGMIGQSLGDPIVSRYKEMYRDTQFFTRGGLRISLLVDFSEHPGGEHIKKHRRHDTSTGEPITVKVSGRGVSYEQQFPYGTRFEAIASAVAKKVKPKKRGAPTSLQAVHGATMQKHIDEFKRLCELYKVPWPDTPLSPNMMYMLELTHRAIGSALHGYWARGARPSFDRVILQIDQVWENATHKIPPQIAAIKLALQKSFKDRTNKARSMSDVGSIVQSKLGMH